MEALRQHRRGAWPGPPPRAAGVCREWLMTRGCDGWPTHREPSHPGAPQREWGHVENVRRLAPSHPLKAGAPGAGSREGEKEAQHSHESRAEGRLPSQQPGAGPRRGGPGGRGGRRGGGAGHRSGPAHLLWWRCGGKALGEQQPGGDAPEGTMGRAELPSPGMRILGHFPGSRRAFNGVRQLAVSRLDMKN